MAGAAEVGALIREARHRKEWTQEQLAERMRAKGLGATANYCGKLEHGMFLPTRETMRVLADVLDIPIGRLYEAAGMLDGVLRPRADQEGGDWVDAVVEMLRDDPLFAESYRLMVESDPPPEVRELQLAGLVRLWRESVRLVALGGRT